MFNRASEAAASFRTTREDVYVRANVKLLASDTSSKAT